MSKLLISVDASPAHCAMLLVRSEGYVTTPIASAHIVNRLSLLPRLKSAAKGKVHPGEIRFATETGPMYLIGPGADHFGSADGYSNDHEESRVLFLAWLRRSIRLALSRLEAEADGAKIHACAIEDYAYAAAQGAHQIGEVGGLYRLELMDVAPLRTIDATTIKKSFTGHGLADKTMMGDEFRRRHPDWTLRPLTNNAGKPTVVYEDWVDAWASAQIMGLALHVRSGDIAFGDVPENLRQILARTTKAHPEAMAHRALASVESFNDYVVRRLCRDHRDRL